MNDGLEIRKSVSGDLASIETLYPDAFPDEDLLPLVHDLVKETSSTLSLVGMMGSSLVSHVIFTNCGLTESQEKLALLGPLAVASASQRQGIGSALVRSGLQELDNEGVTQVYVLGDPAYYRRFGFLAEPGVTPPFPLPVEWREAWQSMSLKNAKPPRQGKLSLPEPWLQPALWAP